MRARPKESVGGFGKVFAVLLPKFPIRPNCGEALCLFYDEGLCHTYNRGPLNEKTYEHVTHEFRDMYVYIHATRVRHFLAH